MNKHIRLDDLPEELQKNLLMAYVGEPDLQVFVINLHRNWAICDWALSMFSYLTPTDRLIVKRHLSEIETFIVNAMETVACSDTPDYNFSVKEARKLLALLREKGYIKE